MHAERKHSLGDLTDVSARTKPLAVSTTGDVSRPNEAPLPAFKTSSQQCFSFQNEMKHFFLHTFIQKICLKVVKIYNIQG